MRIITFMAFFLAATLGFFTATAQETSSSLSGNLKDSKGNPASGVTVTVKYEPTGFVSTATSNSKGVFYLSNLQAGGPYTINLSLVGHKTETRTNYTLILGSNNLDLKFTEASTTLNTVVVQGKAGAKGANVSINQNQIRNIPSLNRSLQDLTKLTPQSNNNSFAGTNFRYNNVTIDGAINNDAIGFSPSLGGQTNASGPARQ
ncbi:MAG: carboxypeptidase-like regulatory domain-containing protein [Ferruginibacter sp.]